MEKRGQVAIFVIVALVIVGAVLVMFMYPEINPFAGPRELSPDRYLSDCIEPEFNNALDVLSRQGGYENPPAYINYIGDKIAYLCYSSGYYKPCVVQQPVLMSHFSNELSRILTPKADTCMRNLIVEYEKRGYSVQYSDISSEVILAPGRAKIEFDSPMTTTLDDVTKEFERFDVDIESGIYDLLGIATSIIDYEATFGDSETRLYTQYYPNLKIEKLKMEHGIKIYKLTDVLTEESFAFATRSLVWPPGYGL